MLAIHDLDINIVGTIEDPVTKYNYNERLLQVRHDAWVIAVDAYIGGDVGTYKIEDGGVHPGSALNTGIPPVGDTRVKCYTGATLLEMTLASPWMISRMAHEITTELLAIVRNQQIKVPI
jgi:putative sporulation protein YyaC